MRTRSATSRRAIPSCHSLPIASQRRFRLKRRNRNWISASCGTSAGKTILLGVIDLGNPEIETADVVAGRIRNGLKYVAAERLIPAPDCGMKYMPRHVAFGKLKAMCDAAAMVRKEIG